MNLLKYLKLKKSQLLETKNSNTNSENNISIIIENSNNLFENEEEIIMEGAKTFFESGEVKSIEEGIIVCAVIIRGLKFIKTEKDENGNIKIILKDNSHEKAKTKKL